MELVDDPTGRGRPPVPLRARLRDPRPLLTVELRPPRRQLRSDRALDAWIDTYQAVRRIATLDTAVFLTDDAVGVPEEENLSHLVRNLGPDAPRERIVPFLTLKHPLEYCERYVERAGRAAFPGLVVLGGDPQDGAPRCLPHAWHLRERVRRQHPGLLLGGWANPYRDAAEQIAYLRAHRDSLDFVLTQIVSHHDPGPVERFLAEAGGRGLDLPIFAGVFVYRSANPRTLRMLSRFMPVPEAGLARDFGAGGLRPHDVAAATVRWLAGLGLSRFYLSNIPTASAPRWMSSIARLAGIEPPSSLRGPAGRRGRR